MNQHKDLPTGSQAWARKVDALMEENAHLKEVVRRLCENAGLDYSNPKRGLSSGGAPSTNNPVGQKLSSLADVEIYNVADEQVLTWSQQGQRWMPATLTSGGAPFAPDPSTTSRSTKPLGYTMAYGVGEDETSTSEGPYGWWGWTEEGDLDAATRSKSLAYKCGIYTTTQDGTITIYGGTADDLVRARINVRGDANVVDIRAASMGIPVCTTATRPTSWTTGVTRMVWDRDLGKPIYRYQNQAWRDAAGTAV